MALEKLKSLDRLSRCTCHISVTVLSSSKNTKSQDLPSEEDLLHHRTMATCTTNQSTRGESQRLQASHAAEEYTSLVENEQGCADLCSNESLSHDDTNLLYKEPLFMNHIFKECSFQEEMQRHGVSQANGLETPIAFSHQSEATSRLVTDNYHDKASKADTSVAIIVFNTAISYHLLHLSSISAEAEGLPAKLLAPFHKDAPTIQQDRIGSSPVEQETFQTHRKSRAKRLYLKSIELLTVLGDNEHDASNVLERHKGSMYNLATLASMNNLLSILDKDDVSRAGLLSLYCQFATTWSKEDNKRDLQHSLVKDKANRSPLSKFCVRWRDEFLGNAIIMYLNYMGIIYIQSTAKAA